MRFFVRIISASRRSRGRLVSRLWWGARSLFANVGLLWAGCDAWHESGYRSVSPWLRDNMTRDNYRDALHYRQQPIITIRSQSISGGCVCWLSYWSGNYNNTQHFSETWGRANDWYGHRVVCPPTPRVNNRGQRISVTHAGGDSWTVIDNSPWCHCNLGGK